WRERVASGWQRLRVKQVVLGLAGGTALAVVVATAVIVSQQGPDNTTTPLQAKPGVSEVGHAQPPTTSGLPNGEAAPNGTATGAPATGPSSIAVPPGSGGLRRRQIERSAQITLGTDPDHVQEVSGGVFDTVRRYGGIVLSSSVSDGTEGEAGASFELLFPSFR